MNKEILLIVNPVAGNGRAKKDIKKIEENLKESGFNIQTEYTTIENNAEKIVSKKADNKELILAIGGDGTLNEVVNGASKLRKKINVGFIPFGTTNDFARTLKIPTNKFLLSKNITSAKKKSCDTGTFNGKCFNYVSAFGTFAKTSYETNRKMKNYFGRLAYIVNGTRKFLEEEEESYHLKIEANNQIIEDDFIYGSISNSNYIGGFRMFKNEEVDINDGKFEVLLIKKQKNKAKLLKTYAKLINQKRDNSVIYFKASKIKIETEQKMKWSLDGEIQESQGIIEIKNIEKNIDFLTM